jgi:hypothetical protein
MYKGIVLESDALHKKSTIYLPDWKCVTTCLNTSEWEPNTTHWFKLFLFEEEDRFRKKIQIAWIPEKEIEREKNKNIDYY